MDKKGVSRYNDMFEIAVAIRAYFKETKTMRMWLQCHKGEGRQGRRGGGRDHTEPQRPHWESQVHFM